MIKDFMITDVISVTEEMTVKQLLEVLVKHKIGGVPVVDKNNKLAGIITDGDVIRHINPKGRTVYDLFSLIMVSEKENLTDKLEYVLHHPVSKLMQKKVLTVKPEDDLEVALNILSHYHFKKIPVADQQKNVVGVISRGDIIRFITMQLISNG